MSILTFPYFNICMFTEEDGTTINEEKKIFWIRKNSEMYSILGLQEKSTFLKIATQIFEAGDFLNIFLRFWTFWGPFSDKNFSYRNKKRVFCLSGQTRCLNVNFACYCNFWLDVFLFRWHSSRVKLSFLYTCSLTHDAFCFTCYSRCVKVSSAHTCSLGQDVSCLPCHF